MKPFSLTLRSTNTSPPQPKIKPLTQSTVSPRPTTRTRSRRSWCHQPA
ncbi:MAG: hypothetical protein NT070_00080 [Cyanobacteria bacterium]|nr:hypothetical protein [Cyanobacteriota bacterium]